jgi:heat-inducible transcriptional repressor
MDTQEGRLTDRQERILGFIVGEYIDSALPVGSQAIAERSRLGISPATIRSEMARLEEDSYLTHPHTSAGRVPTPRAYRYFVEFLMQESVLSLDVRRMIEHQFHQLDMELEEWMRLAAAVLASRARTASLVTAPKSRRPRCRRVDLVPAGEMTILLLVVLQDGAVRRRVVDLRGAWPVANLSKMADELSNVLVGLGSEEVRSTVAELGPVQRELGAHVAELMDDVEVHGSLELYRYGLAEILRQPEFAGSKNVEKVVEVLETPGRLEAILAEVALAHGGVQVVIGGEGRWPEISDFSLVVARYGPRWESPGVVGIVGPTRMSYDKNIPIVSYVAHLMSTLMPNWVTS